MKILLVCPDIDHAGGKVRMSAGFNKYTGHECHCVTGRPQHFRFGIDWARGDPRVESYAAEADVFVYFIRDWFQTPELLPYLPGKKVLFKAQSRYTRDPNPKRFERTNVKVLNYKVDAFRYENEEWIPLYTPDYAPAKLEYKKPYIISQSPTDRARKSTLVLQQAVRQLGNATLEILEGTFANVIKRKPYSHLAFDNLLEGHEGMSAYEYFSMGVPTYVRLHPAQMLTLGLWFGGTLPFLPIEGADQLLANMKKRLRAPRQLEDLHEATRELFLEKHHPKRVLSRWLEAFEDTKPFRGTP